MKATGVLALVHELEVAGLCGGWLAALENGNIERADRLGFTRLESAVRTAYELADEDTTPLLKAMPNIQESMQRSAEYLSSRGSGLASWATVEVAKASRRDEVMSQAEQDRRVDYVEFLTTNIEETKRFYSGVFGWEFTDYGPEYTSFTDGRMRGGFALAPTVSAGGPLVVLYATNLEQIEAAVRDSGGRIVRDAFEFPGGRRFHFGDPSGNELAVWSDR